MKKFIVILAGVFLLMSNWALAEEQTQSDILQKLSDLQTAIENLSNEPEVVITKCPIPESAYNQIDCFKCHLPGNFDVKETNPDDQFTYPSKNMKRVKENGQEVLYFLLTDIPTNELRDAFWYMERNGIKKMVMEIFSGGGSVYFALRDKNYIDEFKAKGIEVETRLYGLAASAGLVMFLTGDTRLMSPHANIMWHEIQSVKIMFGMGISFEISTPSDKEDEARILRFMNDNLQEYVASRCKLSKDDLDLLVKKREMWINHEKALEYGFATGLLQ